MQGGNGHMPDMNELLGRVVEAGGSDLHLTVGMPPIMRLNGRLLRLEGQPLDESVTRELAYSIMTQEQRERLERMREHDFAYTIPGRGRFRVNAYFQSGSVAAALRVIPQDVKTFDQLGLPAVLMELAAKPRGFVLVTGPTGSGKSTTLASMIDYINANKSVHIMTVEDPIEYVHQHKRSMVNQREVGFDTLGFAEALRNVLRQDPDVILIGELRDLETVQTALTAAETGHLVLATLHTQDAVQTIDRIIDVFPHHQQQQVRIQLSTTLQGIVSQQLVPSIDGSGRALAVEVLMPTAAIRNLIREAKTHQLVTSMQTGQQYGMVTMDRSLAELCRRGSISLDAALQRAADASVLRQLVGMPK